MMVLMVWKILGRKAKALVVGGIRQIIFSFYSLPDISIFWGPELSSSITWNFQWLSRNCTQSFGSTPKNFKPQCNMKATCNIKVFFKLPCQAETRKRVISKKTWIDLPFDDLFVFCFYEGRNSDDPSFYYYCTIWCINSSSRRNDKTFYPISILQKNYLYVLKVRFRWIAIRGHRPVRGQVVAKIVTPSFTHFFKLYLGCVKEMAFWNSHPSYQYRSTPRTPPFKGVEWRTLLVDHCLATTPSQPGTPSGATAA